jgi:hypothetical protein
MNEHGRFADAHNDNVPLSAEAIRRKAQILAAAESALTRRVVRRRAMQGAAAIGAVLVLTAGVLQLQGGSAAPGTKPAGAVLAQDDGEKATPTATPVEEEHENREATGPRFRIAIIGDDPAVLERLTSYTVVVRVAEVDDAELLAMLHAAGRREGLIRAGGRVMLSSEVRAMAEARETPGRG